MRGCYAVDAEAARLDAILALFNLSAWRAHCGLDGACLTGERLSLIGSIVFPQRRTRFFP
jgi:hypothetical protein